MAKLKCKGTALQQKIATVFVAVAQIISLDKDEMASETYESDTLDNADAGIPYDATGRSEGGNLSGELFLDPALAGHKVLTALIAYPQEEDWKLIFTNAVEWPFKGAGFGMGATVALNDGLKAAFTIKLSKLPTFPDVTSTSAA